MIEDFNDIKEDFNDIKNDSIYLEFGMYFPDIEKYVVEAYRTNNPFELIVKLNDGESFSYYSLHKTLRRLPKKEYLREEPRLRREFGLRLRQIMEVKNVSQVMLSNLTGLTQPNISQYINGTKTPSFFTVDKIARALNCSTDDFRCIF